MQCIIEDYRFTQPPIDDQRYEFINNLQQRDASELAGFVLRDLHEDALTKGFFYEG